MDDSKLPSKCIGIIGLGLIGGSLGLELQSLGYRVHGLVSKEETKNRALERGLAQSISTDPRIIANCDLIIVALPLGKLINPPEEIIKVLPEKSIVTDVGSVKKPILNRWEKLHPRFVPSHPMAGTAESGVEAGHLGLFKNRPWVVTPNNNTDNEALNVVNKLATILEANYIRTEAEIHDKAVSLISHLPIIISAALIKSAINEDDSSALNLAKKIASSGFSDTTRVGGGNATLGKEIISSNRNHILKALSTYKFSLDELEKIIIDNDWGKLKNELKNTNQKRNEFI